MTSSRARRWIVAVVVVGALLGVADVVAAKVAEGQVAQYAERSVPGATADAEVSSFPFVPRLLLSGRVRSVHLRLAPVDFRRLQGEVTVSLRGLQLDRDALLRGDVDLRDLDRGRIDVRFSPAAIGALVGRTVVIEGDRAFLEVAGRRLPATVAADRERLRLMVAGVAPIDVEIARSDLMPCAPVATVEQGAVVVGCDITEIPEALLRRVVG